MKTNTTITSVPTWYTGTTNTSNDTEEIWRNIEDYEGVYQVSNLGRVKSLHRGKEMILKPMHRNCDKYLRISLHKNGKVKYEYLHRLVAKAFIKNPYNFPEVNHLNTNPRDCRVENLEWCTRKHNMNYYKTRQNKSKKVYCYDNDTMELVFTYCSCGSCASSFQTSRNYISYIIKNNKLYSALVSHATHESSKNLAYGLTYIRSSSWSNTSFLFNSPSSILIIISILIPPTKYFRIAPLNRMNF